MIIYEKFGDVTVAISDISSATTVIKYQDEPSPIATETQNNKEEDEPNLYTSTVTSSIPGIKKLISSVVQSISNELELIKSLKSPDEIELELGFTLKAGVWFLGLENENEVKLKIIWRK